MNKHNKACRNITKNLECIIHVIYFFVKIYFLKKKFIKKIYITIYEFFLRKIILLEVILRSHSNKNVLFISVISNILQTSKNSFSVKSNTLTIVLFLKLSCHYYNIYLSGLTYIKMQISNV